MWRTKLTLEALENRSHIPDSTLNLWEHGLRGAKLKQVATMSHWLKCPVEVIMGLQPCSTKCPHCELYQP